ncbi:TonB-dependent receptor [bacterium]|nr:TonB-dependent receptor [bacterium]
MVVRTVTRSAFAMIVVLFLSTAGLAADIRGTILDDEGTALAGANVVVEGTSLGAASNLDGEFLIKNVPQGELTLTVSLLGYKTRTLVVSASATDANSGKPSITIELDPDAVALEQVTFETERSQSGPVNDGAERVEVLTSDDLEEQSADGGLLSALSGGSGLDTKPCALCGSAGVGMQGLDPSYTEINVDGLPILSGLGALYGLDGINVSDLQQVEISKGGTRSDAGAGAMAGAVNLVTNSPDLSLAELPTGQLSAMAGETGRHRLNGAITVPVADMPVRINANYGAEPRKIDRNSDGLTDTPSYTRFNLSLSSKRALPAGALTTRVRGYGEDRFAGETHWTEDDRGSATVYGRDIQTRRVDTGVSFVSQELDWGFWKLDGAYAFHQQDSWYGTTEYDAVQVIGLARFTINRDWSVMHKSMARLQYRHEVYDDNLRLSSPTDRTDYIPGLLLQHEWLPNERWQARASVLSELYDEDGYVATPRASLRFSPDDSWSFIGSAGLGYRIVTLFSLDKAAHAGFDNIAIPEDLDAERTAGGSLTAQYRGGSASRAFTADLTGFYTRFDNKVVVAFGHAETGEVIYANADDAFSRGVELQLGYAFDPGWSANVHGTVSDIQYHDGTEWRKEEMRSFYTAGASLVKEWTGIGLRANVDGRVFGPQELPHGRGRDQSPTYVIMDLGLRKSWDQFALTLKAENITDYVQPDEVFTINPDTGERRLDSAMIYGPQLGRTVMLTFSANFGG